MTSKTSFPYWSPPPPSTTTTSCHLFSQVYTGFGEHALNYSAVWRELGCTSADQSWALRKEMGTWFRSCFSVTPPHTPYPPSYCLILYLLFLSLLYCVLFSISLLRRALTKVVCIAHICARYARQPGCSVKGLSSFYYTSVFGNFIFIFYLEGGYGFIFLPRKYVRWCFQEWMQVLMFAWYLLPIAHE